MTTDTPQHMKALERANVVRLGRASLKRSIRSGEVSVIDVVRDCPEEAKTMALAELLTSQRRWGATRARKFLAPLMLSERKPLGSLTERQRRLLLAALDEKAGRPSVLAA